MNSNSKSWASVAKEVLLLAKIIIDDLAIDRENGLEVLTSLLFRRVVYGFEAVLLLTTHRLFTEARLQIRGILEALFSLRALWKQPDTVSDFVNNDVHRRIKLYTNFGKTSKKFREQHLNGMSDDRIKEILLDLNRERSSPYLSMKSLSQKAGLYDLFLSHYAILSETAHHLAKDLERHVVVDKENNIIEFLIEDEATNESDILYPALDYTLMACHAINNIFGIDHNSEIHRLNESANELAKSAQNT